MSGTNENAMAQTMFLMQGGAAARSLMDMRKRGIMASEYVHHEYPKMVYISRGVQRIERSTEIGNGTKSRTWTEEKEVFDRIQVSSEDEEERVLSGGKTSAQMEDDRQLLITRCRTAGVLVDPSWSAVRLRRELGEKLDAPEPADEMGALKAKLAQLQEMDRMKAEIAALEARLAGRPIDEAADLRAQLEAIGVTPDKRWGIDRLRAELDAATAPKAAA